MIISQFLEYTDAPILRFDEQVKKGQSVWKDPYSGETMKQVAEDGDEDDDDGGGDGNDQGGGGAGGNGGAGGGGPGGSGNGQGGGGDDKDKDKRERQERAKKRAEGNAKRQAEENARRRTDLEGVHLGFRASRHHLWSGGFSELSQLNPTVAALAGPAPGSAQDGVSSPALDAMYGLTASDQQRRVSAGSTHSSGSATSTRTDARSLFDERASSVPPSPATTANFSDSPQSRDGSPFPEKAAGREMGSPGPTSATISNAGILLHNILGQSAIGIVWSGKMIPEDGSDKDTSIAIAVKMAVPRDNGHSEATDDERECIRQEGTVYDFLAKSGKQDILPHCYGVFEDEVGTVALILDNIDNLNRKQTLFATTVEMHSVGVRHNDLAPRNIVQDSEGKLRIIDFHIADIDHVCLGKEKCKELMKLREKLGLSGGADGEVQAQRITLL
ncbi:hypothetical protein C8R47DRAFT_1070209 [Mycena vitilis]|nr:hypothetical protein C8R47DRAFT_1070209 [Mycena vitilis]